MIGKLRVYIVPDEGSWYAQGLEVDYGAQGETPEEAISNFVRGLKETFKQNINNRGNIFGVLKKNNFCNLCVF